MCTNPPLSLFASLIKFLTARICLNEPLLIYRLNPERRHGIDTDSDLEVGMKPSRACKTRCVAALRERLLLEHVEIIAEGLLDERS